MTSIPSKLKKNSTFGSFFGRQMTQILKPALSKLGRNFLHKRKFHKAQFYFFKDLRAYFHNLSRFQVTARIYSNELQKMFRRILEMLHLHGLQKNFCVHFQDLCVQKTKMFGVKFRHILEVLHLQGLKKMFWVRFHDLFDQKRSCLL